MLSSSDSSSDEEATTNQPQQAPPLPGAAAAQSSSSSGDSSSEEENTGTNQPEKNKDETKSEPKTEAKTTSKDEDTNNNSSGSSDSDDGSTKPTKSGGNQGNLFGSDSSSSDEDSEKRAKTDKPVVTTEVTGNTEATGNNNNDLFGDDGDSSDSNDEETVKEDVTLSGNKIKDGSSSSSSEEEEEATKINVEIPKIATNLGEEIHFVRLPNFLSVEPKPFDQQYYQDEEEEDQNQVLDEEGHARLRLRVENTIRWRTVTDPVTGEERRESNARYIKYNDGSVMMQVGSEMFDVTCMPLSDYSHLFIRQGTGLQGQAVFKQKLTFRPTSIHSLTHKKVMTRLQQRSNQNVTKVRMINTIEEDPEISRDKKWKEQEVSLKLATQKKNAEARRKVKKVQSGGGKNKRISGSYLDSVGHRGDNIYSESDSELSSDGDKKPKPSKSSNMNLDSTDSDSDKKITDEDSDSDDDAKKKKKNMLSSSSDSDSD